HRRHPHLSRGLGPRPACARSRQGEPPPARLRRAALARDRAVVARPVEAQARALHLLADRPRARAARRRRGRRAAQAASGSRDRVARTQHPVTAVLEARGERIHPASAHLANESHHIESESAEHDLHCFQAWRRMDEILCANFMVFHDLVRDEPYDVWIGDEAWELDYYLHENPEQNSAAYVWLPDFVGWLPMPDGGEREAFLAADYNGEMI